MARTKEGYNYIVVTYFGGTYHEHYIPRSRYVITQTYGRLKVGRLKGLMENLTFCQGNTYALGSLVFVMLTVEKELMKWNACFS
jgi:hypothetical protein